MSVGSDGGVAAVGGTDSIAFVECGAGDAAGEFVVDWEGAGGNSNDESSSKLEIRMTNIGDLESI